MTVMTPIITGDYQATADEWVRASGTLTVILPLHTAAGVSVVVQQVGSGTVTIAGVINGAANASLAAPFATLVLRSLGGDRWATAEDGAPVTQEGDAASIRTNLGLGGAAVMSTAQIAADPAFTDTYATYGPAAPTSPSASQMWFSTALADGTISPAARDRIALFTSGYEASVVLISGIFYMFYTHYPSIRYRMCSGDPTVPGNWSTEGTAFGGGSFGTNIGLSGVYEESDTLYCFYVDYDSRNVKLASASTSAPTSWTYIGVVFANPGGYTLGNIFVVKDSDTYRMFWEHQDTTTSHGATVQCWLTGLASSISVDGPYVSTITTLETLRPGYGEGSASGPWVMKEGDTWVAYYHGCSWAPSNPTAIYRATCTDLTGDSWTIDGEMAIAIRSHKAEVDQIGDAFLCLGPGGIWYVFWEGVNNRAHETTMMVTRLLPMPRIWNGTEWVAMATSGPGTSDLSRLPQWITSGETGLTPPALSGTWTKSYVTGLGNCLTNASNTQGDYIEYDVMLQPGLWDLQVNYTRDSSRADILCEIDDGGGYFTLPVIGTISGYAATNYQDTNSPIQFRIYGEETVNRRLRFTSATRNASSSGWYIQMHTFQLRRIGE